MRPKIWIVAGIIILLIAACNQPNPSSTQIASVQAWFDVPINSPENIPLEPFLLIFHAASPQGIDEFELKVNGVFESTVQSTLFGGDFTEGGIDALVYGEYLWAPPAPGTYLIEVRAKQVGNGFGDSIQIEFIVGDQEIIVTETSTPIPMSETPSPTSTFTAVPEKCFFEAVVNLFCRIGPDSKYPEVDSMVPGEMGEVIGISEDGFYVYLIGPHSGLQCAVPNATQFGVLSGDCDDLPIITNPQLPEDNPRGDPPTPTLLIPIIVIPPTATKIPPPPN